MSFRPGILPSLLRAAHPVRGAPTRSFHFLSRGTQHAPTTPRGRVQNAYLYSIGLGLAAITVFPRAAHCASAEPLPTPVTQGRPQPSVAVVNTVPDDPEVRSILSLGQLSFGAVCGICAGVFVKKGFKIVAFALGGVYVLLQYLSSKKFVQVDWKAVGTAYDGQFATVDQATGKVVYPTATGVWNGFIDFLTANFQQRATFLAGFVLGVRLG
ncbi:uncharacterized protein EHS24_007477 [Apiotrichum porosum]|uniref:FUN14 family-domain-containing protein n=1 Tax=Apiotrichum porosum TaxID=105984 RepID=A0A427XUM2_9TREE|nr:uncharacterized protein EHS24_007477 [Apiotrichum porosum]RSH82497.1 hypothetical protein EHS24_007477 [Apiotrichum porosum]